MSQSPIHLDVGGQLFKTSYQTLIIAPYFQALERINGQISGTVEKPLFIDRDPEIFKHILNLLRNPKYHFPTEFLPELPFWGFPVEDYPDHGQKYLNDVTDSSLIKEPTSKRKLIQYTIINPEISYHVACARRSSFYSNALNRRSFDKLPWSLEITDDYLGNYFILIPQSIALTDLLNFEVVIEINNSESIYRNQIHLHQYLMVDNDELNHISLVTVDGFHYVPVNLLINSNEQIPIFKTPEQKITITLRHNELIDLPTAICYYTPKQGQVERHWTEYSMYEIYFQECIEIPIINDTVNLPAGLLRYLIWKTDEFADEVSLVSKKYSPDPLTRAETCIEQAYTLKRGDFQYLERSKVGLEPLALTWGAMYFSKQPMNVKCIGGLDIDETFSLKFSKPVTGILWANYTQVWIFSNEFNDNNVIVNRKITIEK